MRTHRYQDISHFRAPYKDSFLSGLGAFGAVESVPTRIVKVDGQDVVGIDVAKQNAISPSAPPAVYGMAIDWGYKIAPTERDASGQVVVDSAMLITTEAAVAEKSKGNTGIDTVVNTVLQAVPQGFYVVAPIEVDTTKIGKHLLIARRSALPRVAGPSTGSVVIAGPPDADFGFSQPGPVGPNKKASIATIAGYTAVGLLIVSALAMASKKRR